MAVTGGNKEATNIQGLVVGVTEYGPLPNVNHSSSIHFEFTSKGDPLLNISRIPNDPGLGRSRMDGRHTHDPGAGLCEWWQYCTTLPLHSCLSQSPTMFHPLPLPHSALCHSTSSPTTLTVSPASLYPCIYHHLQPLNRTV